MLPMSQFSGFSTKSHIFYYFQDNKESYMNRDGWGQYIVQEWKQVILEWVSLLSLDPLIFLI